MSGVFGYIEQHPDGSSPAVIQRMADTLRLREWHQTQIWADAQLGTALGQLNIGLFSTDIQPAHSEDGSLAACYFGDVLNREALRSACQGELPDSNAQLILRLYQNQGESFIKDLEGVFSFSIWDSIRKRLVLANDQYGLLPHYYTHQNGKLAFAPLIYSLTQIPGFEKKLNLDAVAEFFRFQRLLGTKTFFENVQLLPYGGVLTYEADTDQLDVSHYWDFDRVSTWSGASFDEAVDETGRLLRQSVEKRLSGPWKFGIYLSGGLDSRTLLGFSSQYQSRIPTVTYGHPNSKDVVYATRLARRCNSDHHYFPQENGAWLQDFVDLHLALTEGQIVFVHGHASNTLNPARQIMQVNLTGFNGDQWLGGRGLTVGNQAAYAVDELNFLTQSFTYFNQRFSWPGITEPEEKVLYTPALRSQITDRAFESFCREVNHYSHFPFPQRLDYFSSIAQGTRLSNLNVVYQRAFFEARYPYCDYRLTDFILSMPVDYRKNDRLYLAMINRQVPRVTSVPRDTDDLLPIQNNFIRGIEKMVLKIQRRLLVGRRYQQIHGDPEVWLREDLRQWAAGILFDRRTEERGIINPAFIRSIFDRHMSGQEIWTIGKIAPIITFEMMMRRYFD